MGCHLITSHCINLTAKEAGTRVVVLPVPSLGYKVNSRKQLHYIRAYPLMNKIFLNSCWLNP